MKRELRRRYGHSRPAGMSDRYSWRIVAMALRNALNAAIESGDLAKMDAVHEIAAADGMTAGRLIERLGSSELNAEGVTYVTPFLLEVCGGSKSNALKRATGRDRTRWLEVQEAIRKRSR